MFFHVKCVYDIICIYTIVYEIIYTISYINHRYIKLYMI